MVDIDARDATAADANGIARVHVRSWQGAYRGLMPDAHLDSLDESARAEVWRRSIERGLGHVLVAEADGEIAGFVACFASRDEDAPARCGEVGAIYLDPGFWDCGIGWTLMSAAIDRLTSDGYTEVTLWVLAGNERAMRFYERCGFVIDGSEKVDDAMGIALHELRYRRPLGSP